MKRIATDVCIVGGGPAGAAVARRLAALGHRVLVVERRPRGDGATAVAESIARSIVPVLDALGIASKVLAAGFQTSLRRRVRWQGSEAVVDDPALIIDRTTFGAMLHRAALDAGVRIVESSHARSVVARPGGLKIAVESAAEHLEVDARFVVDARGRRAARAGRPAGMPRTTAICGAWRAATAGRDPEMRIEAGANGWYWGAPARGGGYTAVAFVDADAAKRQGPRGLAEMYRTLIAESELLSPCLAGAVLHQVAVRDATCRVDDECVSSRSIKVGDCAFAMDPVSSQGIQSALRSGVQAATVVHTILCGSDADAALEFYRASQQRSARLHQHTAAAVYASQARSDSLFWRARSVAEVPALRIDLPLVPTPKPGSRLRLDPRASIEPIAMIDGDIVRRGAALCHPSLEYPVAWLGGIAIAPLVAQLQAGDTPAEVIERWGRALSPRAACEVLAWLLQRGIVSCP